MRTLAIWCLLIAIPAHAQDTPKPPVKHPAAAPDEKPDGALDAILRNWEERSQADKTLEVRFDRVDRSPAGGTKKFRGQVVFRDEQTFAMDFRKALLDESGKPTGRFEDPPGERLVYSEGRVDYFDSASRTVFVVRTRDSVFGPAWQAGSNPLALFYRVKAEEMKRRFRVTLIKQKPGEALIRLVPLQPSDKRVADQVLVWIDIRSYRLDRLRINQPTGNDAQEFTTQGEGLGYHANPTIDPGLFALEAPPDWRISDGTANLARVSRCVAAAGTIWWIVRALPVPPIP